MIISHRRNLIFIKTRKTAGTSVELLLRSLCDQQDVITHVKEADGPDGSPAGPGRRNQRIPLRQLDVRGAYMFALHRRRPCFYDHIPAYRVRSVVGRKVWNDYLTVTVERNPWDRAISLFHWAQHAHPDRFDGIDLTTFLRSEAGRQANWLSNWYLYTIRNDVVVDHILRYESLEDDLKRLWSRLGAKPPAPLPRAKAGIRRDTRHYTEIMSVQDRDIVTTHCAREIEHFGYEF